MHFQINALPETSFNALFNLDDAELEARNIYRMTVKEYPGSPCRVSLEDAQPGATVLLLNYDHLDADTPYRAAHAIYVSEGAAQASLPQNFVPEVLTRRLISYRCFDADHMMVDADIVDGPELGDALHAAFDNPDVAYAHLHFAKRGCFAASVTRAS